MRFLPAAPNSGVRFRRIDLDGKPEIEARIEHVNETRRSTTLSKGNIKIHTVEHVLATFSGYSIDNVIVELDGNEPPIADGSARIYCEMIVEAGIEAQVEKKDPYRIGEVIQLESGESTMSIFPHDDFKITCTSADRNGRFTQFYSLTVTPETWERDLAHARTFCFFEEIEQLIKHGLIKGGSLENAVVIRDDAVLTNEPLRYTEEFVRHKILDIVGDLSLAGRPLLGHVVAVRPSHTANCELAKAIAVQMRKPIVAAQAFAPPPETAAQPGSAASVPASAGAAPGQGKKKQAGFDPTIVHEIELDTDAIMKHLPHRYPFLMIDRVLKIDGNKIIGLKNVTANENYFQGHFPKHPVMPGVLQLEAIAQLAGILMVRQMENLGKIAYFMAADSVKWRKPVRPGDALIVQAEMIKSRGKIGKARGICSVAGETVSEADITFMIVDESGGI